MLYLMCSGRPHTPQRISPASNAGPFFGAPVARCKRPLLLYQQLDGLQALRREMRGEFLAESRKHEAAKLLRLIPCIGPIRAARLIALMQTPHRFRSKRLGGAHFDC